VSHIYRCSCCRTRNTFSRAVETFVRGKRCRHCGYKRFYVDKARINRPVCRCVGYHHSHRPGSKCCELHPYHLVHRATRAGASAEEVGEAFLDAALQLQARHDDTTCPF